ncbi:Cytidine deaminase, homotetrameric [Metarhizium robertsii ARSEF 23]|uniref:Cytidine deaminase n=1 Tax=Metarhizium robertsii (strain ARSEF 23 / ATCC MYA-3075) TaxID=655844 RepID=E9EW90_METRA|nr:Cytidine deaminase, homotetrameric [Metarhizium robertsii ARSEF 23]EFZ00512.2 Cytidine deaminase, homotetrameric [Metarhizium robertsii ARSEF 23]
MSRAPPTIHASSSAASIAATCEAHALTPEQFAALRSQASAAKAAAYCPYSKFRVGAAVLGDDGSVTTGANVENASYPVGTCAERVALGKAVTDRGLRAFKAVAVATDVAPPASPCGMCRQFIREFCRLDMPVIMFDKDENYVVLTLEELLPLSFGPEKLGM